MIYIRKNKEPESVVKWKKKFKNIYGSRPKYDDIQQKKEKSVLKESLMQEQKYVCCYCCTHLTSDKAHIEHFRPQNVYPDLSLEYKNLFASCQGEKQLKKNCGHAKKNQLYHWQSNIFKKRKSCVMQMTHLHELSNIVKNIGVMIIDPTYWSITGDYERENRFFQMEQHPMENGTSRFIRGIKKEQAVVGPDVQIEIFGIGDYTPVMQQAILEICQMLEENLPPQCPTLQELQNAYDDVMLIGTSDIAHYC